MKLNNLKALILLVGLLTPFLSHATENEVSDELAASTISPLTAVTVNGADLLANGQGLTVYVYDHDTNGASNCNGGCASAWPPVSAPAGVALNPPLGSIKRQDGSAQITYNGRPVYLFASDQKEGDTKGDGLGGVWHVVHLP